MSLIDELAPVFADINASLTEDLGTRVSVYRVAQSGRADTSKSKTYVAAPTLANISVDVLDIVTAAKRCPNGLTEKAEALLLFATVSGVLPTIHLGDGIKVMSGPLKDAKYVALNSGAPDAQGISLGVSVAQAPSAAVMV